MYGIGWSHPNAGGLGGANNLNDHGLLIINNGTFRAAISSRIVASEEVRGTLFRDYNDSGRYVDPGSTSFINGLVSPGNYTNYATSFGWAAGTDSATGYYGGSFSRNGTASENTRLYRTDSEATPFASPGLVLAATNNDGSSNDDGGWNKTVTGVSANKTYRSIIWVRRNSSSTNGTFYHGCSGGTTLNLNNSSNTNPYFGPFGIGSIVQGRWYLSVGYIHANNDGSTTSYGGLYDSVTGQRAITYTDYKMASGATSQVHRVYLYYSTDPAALLEWYGPRFEEINGEEPSINSLLIGSPNSKVVLTSNNFSSYALPLTGGSLSGQLEIRNDNPTITLRDTNHNTAHIHVNGNIFHILRGGNDTAYGAWSTTNGYWPLEINLTNNDALFGRNVTSRGDFYGPRFYERDDTGYFLDPSADRSSNINGFSSRTVEGTKGTYKYNTPRYIHTSDTNYWTGTMGWGNTDLNSVMTWGSGFFDTWGSPSNRPGDTSHYVGVQAYHYVSGYNSGYGWQLVGGVTDSLWWRHSWPNNSGWFKVAMYENNVSAGNFYATRYYSSDSTGYYMDPSETSNINSITVNGDINAYAGVIYAREIRFRDAGGSADSDPYSMRWMDESSNGGLSWLEFQLNDDSNEEIRIYGYSCSGYGCGSISGNLYHRFRSDGYAWHRGDVYTDSNFYGYRFYDRDNTARYADPAGLNQFNQTEQNGRMWYSDYLVSRNNGGLMGNYNAASTASKVIWTIGESWPIGNMYGLGYEYGSGYDHHLALRNNGTTYSRFGFAGGAFIGGNLTLGSDLYAYRFYDRNNTAYYSDPAGTSNYYGLTVNQTISGLIQRAQRIDNVSRSQFTVGGNASTYYPVVFQIGSGATVQQYGEFVIERGGYDDPGYSGIGFSNCNIRFSVKASGWGFGATYEQLEGYFSTFPAMADWLQVSQPSQMVIWLRGATTYFLWNVVGNTTVVNANGSGGSVTIASGASYSYTYNPTTTIQEKAQYGTFSKYYNGGLMTSGRIKSESDMISPVYYDSDTGYYLDANSTSDQALRIRGGTLNGPNPTWGKYLLVGGDGRQNRINDGNVASVCTTNGNLHIDAASGYDTYLNYYDGNNLRFGSGGNSIHSRWRSNGNLYIG